MKKVVVFSLVLSLGLFSLVSLCSASPIPIRSHVWLYSRAQANDSLPIQIPQEYDDESFGEGDIFPTPIIVIPSPLSASTSATSFFDNPDSGFSRDLSAQASMSAAWSSVASGTLDFSWEFDAETIRGDTSYQYPTGVLQPAGGHFMYGFQTDADGNIVVDYDYTSQGDPAVWALTPFWVRLYQNDTTLANQLFMETLSYPSGTGQLMFPVTSGNTYFLEIHQGSSIGGYIGTWGQVTSGTFEFTIPGDGEIPPIPEPATMLLLGSGLAGLAAFRRRFRK